MVDIRKYQLNYQCFNLVTLDYKLLINYRIKDMSIVNDFISETYSKNERLDTITMENCPAILAHCLSLINSKFQSYNINGIKAYNNIFKIFQDVIS